MLAKLWLTEKVVFSRNITGEIQLYVNEPLLKLMKQWWFISIQDPDGDRNPGHTEVNENFAIDFSEAEIKPNEVHYAMKPKQNEKKR